MYSTGLYIFVKHNAAIYNMYTIEENNIVYLSEEKKNSCFIIKVWMLDTFFCGLRLFLFFAASAAGPADAALQYLQGAGI